jgi:hypothetical protein
VTVVLGHSLSLMFLVLLTSSFLLSRKTIVVGIRTQGTGIVELATAIRYWELARSCNENGCLANNLDILLNTCVVEALSGIVYDLALYLERILLRGAKTTIQNDTLA